MIPLREARDITLIADDMGQFFGIAGHHTPRMLLRVIMAETGMMASEVTDGYDTPWQGWRDAVTQGWWRLMSRHDPRSWGEAERLALYEDGDDWSWPHEWDEIYTPCKEIDRWAIRATYWRA